MKKVSASATLDKNASIMSVDGIQEKVAFIKINQLYPKCIDGQGGPDRLKVKDAARAIWIIPNEQKRAQIQYVFAYYRQHILGVFHVVDVSQPISEAYRAGLPDFPIFPPDVRESDRWKARFASVAQARKELSKEEFSRFLGALEKPNKTPDTVLKQVRKRVYFSLDDKVPAHLRAFEGCIVERTKGFGGTLISNSRSPVILNF